MRERDQRSLESGDGVGLSPKAIGSREQALPLLQMQSGWYFPHRRCCLAGQLDQCQEGWFRTANRSRAVKFRLSRFEFAFSCPSVAWGDVNSGSGLFEVCHKKAQNGTKSNA